VHVLDKPEIGNLGDEDDDVELLQEQPVVEKKTPELSSVRITPQSNAGTKPTKVQAEKPVTAQVDNSLELVNKQMLSGQSDAPACNVCGAIMMRSGACYKCNNCGNQGGCS
jgi:ribonucleoside-diphosphate reductase alpha chain